MKKIIGTLLALLICILPVVRAEATTNEAEITQKTFEELVIPESISTVTANEYDTLMELQNTPDEDLLNSGWTQDEIVVLKNFNYEEAYKQRLLESNDEYQLSRQSVEELQNITPEELSRNSATIILRVGVNEVVNSNHDWRFYYEWFWTQEPFFENNDIVGIRGLGAVNGVTAVPVVMSDSYGMVSYSNDAHQYLFQKQYNYKTVDIGVAQSVFPLLRNDSSTTQLGIATSGYGYVHFNNSAPMERLSIAIQYGHSQLTASPSIDVSAGLPPSIGVGFSFTSQVVTEAKIVNTYAPNGSIVQ